MHFRSFLSCAVSLTLYILVPGIAYADLLMIGESEAPPQPIYGRVLSIGESSVRFAAGCSTNDEQTYTWSRIRKLKIQDKCSPRDHSYHTGGSASLGRPAARRTGSCEGATLLLEIAGYSSRIPACRVRYDPNATLTVEYPDRSTESFDPKKLESITVRKK